MNNYEGNKVYKEGLEEVRSGQLEDQIREVAEEKCVMQSENDAMVDEVRQNYLLLQ